MNLVSFTIKPPIYQKSTSGSWCIYGGYRTGTNYWGLRQLVRELKHLARPSMENNSLAHAPPECSPNILTHSGSTPF